MTTNISQQILKEDKTWGNSTLKFSRHLPEEKTFAFRSPSTSTALPISEVMGIITWMAAAPEARTHKKEEAAVLASPCARQPPQPRFVKKTEKAKAVALKLTPSRSFCKVAPELSLGCASASAVLTPVTTGELECRETNLRSPGTAAQRYRQKKKSLAE